MKLPTRVKHPNGNIYDINTSHKVAFKCFELIDSDVSDEERAYGVVRLLFGIESPVDKYMLDKAVVFLQGGEKPNEQDNSNEDLIDLVKDRRYIEMSVESQFPHAKPIEEDIHFWKYIMYIETLKGTVMNDIIEIRSIDLNDYEGKDRKKMRELKNQWSLGDKVKEISLRDLYEQIERGEV